MDKLKPCPFCGGEGKETVEKVDLYVYIPGTFEDAETDKYIYCFQCGATTPDGVWNRREGE